MAKKTYLAVLFSSLIPGLGQMYLGKQERGAIILIVTVIVGNLNALWLSLHGQTSLITDQFWAVTLPRILHDLFAFYSAAFIIWQILDAYKLGKTQLSS